MKDFRKLQVWEKAHQLALALYQVGRDGDPELSRFCTIARGSASELEYQLLLARDLKLIQLNDYEQLSQQTIEIKRMLTVLVQKLNAES